MYPCFQGYIRFVSLLFPLTRPRKVIHITCNMGARDSPDVYALSPAALGL